MTTQSDLESRVRLALEKLAKGAAGDFDMAAYGRAFHPSARSKAQTVVEALSDQHNPFKHLDPVFISVGGADGEELAFLITHTTAESGILIERSRDLAQVARDRSLPSGKKIEVFEGDATDTIRSAIERSSHLVRSQRADYQVVTCHAVIHELFDRGRAGFDPAAFFSTVFGDHTIPTWFTYREPGAPSKWPEDVLVSADCGPMVLQQLAEVLIARQHSLGQLRPSPHVMGDHVRAHRDLAMELIVKLFYIEDLWYEVQERSTSVDHQQMQSFLALAIGDNAVKEKRGLVTSSSSATDSFQNLWKEWGIRVAGLNPDGSRYELPVPESQTRVIAWRSPDTVTAAESQPLADRSGEVPADLAMALSASIVGDIDLLEALLISKGRSWIEQDHRDEALKLLTSARDGHSNNTRIHLWSDYLLSLSGLFSGDNSRPSIFSEERQETAGQYGLDILFLAERMEFLRKGGRHTFSLSTANQLASRLSEFADLDPTDHSPLGRYAIGTAFFVFANLLRSGGLYSFALENLGKAERWLVPNIESHDTERLHCYYARCVCGGIQGSISFRAPFGRLSDVSERFAGALIKLTYSFAAWFVDDLGRAEQYATEAAGMFENVGAVKYRERANTVAGLLRAWQDLQAGQEPPLSSLNGDLARAILFLAGRNQDATWFRDWFRILRPSKAAGILQFRQFSTAGGAVRFDIVLPELLSLDKQGVLQWQSNTVGSLDEAADLLRRHIGASDKNRIPLLAD